MVLFHPSTDEVFILGGGEIVYKYTMNEKGQFYGNPESWTEAIQDGLARERDSPHVFYISMYEREVAFCFRSGHVMVFNV